MLSLLLSHAYLRGARMRLLKEKSEKESLVAMVVGRYVFVCST